MLALLDDVVRELSARGVRHALIGAGAMAAHGASRSTFDLDLLVTDRSVLAAAFWARLAGLGDSVDARTGDDEDPLAGVIRIARPGSRSVDVVVGRSAWQAETLQRAEPRPLREVPIPVVTAEDLVLLKLYAGGPQDAWDIEQLLSLLDRPALVTAVERQLPRLPASAAGLWRRITGAPPAVR
jgi:hypothetical protein